MTIMEKKEAQAQEERSSMINPGFQARGWTDDGNEAVIEEDQQATQSRERGLQVAHTS